MSSSNTLVIALLFTAQTAAAEPLTLQQAVALARKNHERPRVAALQEDAADARVARARAFFFPDITLSGTYTRRAFERTSTVGGETIIIQARNALNANVTLTLPLFDARGIPLYRAAVANHDAAQHDAREIDRLIGFEAADAFFQTLAMRQVREAADRRVALATDSLKEAQTRFEAQLVSSNDVTKADLELASARLQLTAATTDFERARLSLGLLLVTEPPTELTEPGEPVGLNQPHETLIAQALTQRPDLLALTARSRSARLLSDEPLTRLAPTLNLTAQGRATNEAGLSRNTLDGFVAITLSWTIFDGGELFADRRELVALSRVAELNEQLAKRSTQTQVRIALVSLDNARTALTHADASVTAASRNATEVAELYRQGLAGALDTQVARVQLFEAEVARARNRYDLQLAHLALRSATGLDAVGEETHP